MPWKLKQRQQQWLSEERGTVRKSWGGKTRVALAFPNRYAVGMSNLGFQSVYRDLNRMDDVVCERVFYPEPEDLETVRRNPGCLISVESQKSVQDFHLLFFSIPFENDYVHVVEMLSMAGIPPRVQDRGQIFPLAAAGGVAVFLNPEPLSAFLDFFFIGEAEALLPDFLHVWNRIQGESPSRDELLQCLARDVRGIYVPSFYRAGYADDGTLSSMEPLPGLDVPERVEYRRADLSGVEPCRTAVLTPNTEFSDVHLLEIGRGCGRGCRFCAAGYVYRPVRFHDAVKLLEVSTPLLSKSRRLGLVSAAVSDHPEISGLCDALLDRGGVVSFSSLRADNIPPQMLAAIEASQQHAVAIAPEAGSERLRRVINKNLSMDQIISAVERLTERGILQLKLYFMIGLPEETSEDLEAIVDMTKQIKHHVLKITRGRKRLGTITLSIHSFVPKAFTPFQWVGFAGIRELRERSRWIQKALKKVPNVRVHFDLPKWAYIQALLSRGDRRAGLFIEKTALEGVSWSQALRDVPFNPDFWVMRHRGRDERFPWEVIDHGVKREYLWEEYQRALSGRTTSRCRPEEHCTRCGVCALQR